MWHCIWVSSREAQFLLQPPASSSHSTELIKTKRVSFDIGPQHGRHEGRAEEDGRARDRELMRRGLGTTGQVGAVCSFCHSSISYTPAVDAPAQTTHTDFPHNITEALHRLRTDGFEANDLTAHQVKGMVTIVVKGEEPAEQEGGSRGTFQEEGEEEHRGLRHEQGRLGQGVMRGGQFTGEGVRGMDPSQQEPICSHVTHHEDAGEEACIREMSVEEKKQLFWSSSRIQN